MLYEERVKYETLKFWALDSYYDGCRDLAMERGWTHEQVIGYVAHTFEDGFERPVEDLMWQVILLVLSAGRLPAWEERAREDITKQIEKHGLDHLLTGVPEDEVEMFRHDLNSLKLVRAGGV